MTRDPKFEAQKKKVFEAFRQYPMTMLMVEVKTGIMRANICRYVSEWKRGGTIYLLKKDKCPVSKQQAGYYTTNRDLFPRGPINPIQSKLWD